MDIGIDSKEKHDITVIMQESMDNSAFSSPKNSTPLSNNQTVINSIEKRSSKGLPFKSKFSRSPRRSQQIQRQSQSSESLDIINESTRQQSQAIKEEYDELERRYADAVLQYEQFKVENQKLRDEVQLNQDEVVSLKSNLESVEQSLVDLESEKQRLKEASIQNETLYKKAIESLQTKIEDLTMQLTTSNTSNVPVSRGGNALVTKYEKLLRDYKVLQHQFEVEKSSKIVLMDQIEFLAHKNEELANQLESPITDDMESEGNKSVNGYITDASHYIRDGDDHYIEYDSNMDIGDQSFPGGESTSESVKVTSNFQFPPSPDPKSKEQKRLSLPVNLKEQCAPQPPDFVLSPFKLTPGPSTSNREEGVFENTNAADIEDYLTSNPSHVRYNSHDILPIKVEFEAEPVRFTSVPEKVLKHNPGFNVIEQTFDAEYAKLHHRDGTFCALNGMDSEDTGFDSSQHMSYDEFDLSSKRSSYLNTDSKTRQEITKLKFELQSLKLHNEKLLSYIGFELQKQKKNIKKLAKKQSARSLRTLSKQMEYSDAKLIEESKNMLINQKRVLRSVSINAVFNKNENFANPVGLNIGTANDGFNTAPDLYPFESEADKSHESNFVNDKIVKKFASQIMNRNDLYSLSEDEVDSDFENDSWALAEDGENENGQEYYDITSSSSSSSEEEENMIHKIRSFVLGTPKDTKKKRKDDLIDDNLKFKFLTIALGIAIIGLKLTPKSQLAITQ